MVIIIIIISSSSSSSSSISFGVHWLIHRYGFYLLLQITTNFE